MFTLTIETGNAAFQDGPEELARLVERVADALRDGRTRGPVIDTNGNRVGSWEMTPR